MKKLTQIDSKAKPASTQEINLNVAGVNISEKKVTRIIMLTQRQIEALPM